MIPALIGAGAAIGSSIIGSKAQADAAERARTLIQQSIDEYNKIGIPPAEAMQMSFEKYRSAGILTPELEQNILQGDSELNNIETDPRLMDAQMSALDELRTRGQGGFNIGDKASLQKGLDAAATQERGQREAILQDMSQRGASTSGGSLAAQLMNQQGSAARANQAGLDTAAQGYQNALESLRLGGTMAGNMQTNQFGQKAQVASAQDAINQMNARAMQGVQQRNVGGKNAAQQYNLGNAQNLSNANTDLSNQNQMYNRDAMQNYFNNQMAVGQAKSNARSGQASSIQQQGNQAAQMWGGAGSMAAKTGAGISASNEEAEQREKDRQAGITTRR